MPDAFGPRNEGQLPFAAAGFGSAEGRSGPLLTIFRSGIGTGSPSGRHVLPLRIIRRGTQSSATTASVSTVRSVLNRYRPGAAHGGGPPVVCTVTSSRSAFHVPGNVGQPAPLKVNAPSAAKWILKFRYCKAADGNDWGCCAAGAAIANVVKRTTLRRTG